MIKKPSEKDNILIIDDPEIKDKKEKEKLPLLTNVDIDKEETGDNIEKNSNC